MKKLLILGTVLGALFPSSFTIAASGCETLQADAGGVLSRYFQMINYEHKKPREVMAFEADFQRLVDCALPLHGNRETATLLFYGALLLKNNSQGASSGQIPFRNLVEFNRYSRGGLQAEVTARAERSLELLELARARDSSDRRIPGWIAGARISLERSRHGIVSRESFRQMMREAEAYPEFNALTALLAFSEVELEPDQEQEVLEHTERMLDLKKSPCSPLKSEKDRTCSNSDKAQFNLQNSMAILADVLLREAGSQSGNGLSGSVKARSLAGRAKFILGMNLFPNEIGVTLRWDRKDLLFDRMKFASKAMVLPSRAADFWQKSWRKRAYQCASCHSPAH